MQNNVVAVKKSVVLFMDIQKIFERDTSGGFYQSRLVQNLLSYLSG